MLFYFLGRDVEEMIKQRLNASKIKSVIVVMVITPLVLLNLNVTNSKLMLSPQSGVLIHNQTQTKITPQSLITQSQPRTQTVVQTAGKSSQPVPLQVVISMASGVNANKVAEVFGAKVMRLGPLNFATLEFNSSETLAQVITKLKSYPGILGAQENYRRKIIGTLSLTQPTDTYYHDQWSLKAGDVQGAWDMGATGQGVTIAVVDTGVDLNHPDLKNNLVPGYNSITQSAAAGANQDDNGHGTHVSGIAAAEKNGIGIVGVAYKAKIMPIKAIDSSGEGYDDNIAAGIVWAADHGAKIINLSVGSPNGSDPSDVLKQAVAYAYKKGCLIIAASGNFDPTQETDPGVSYPAADPHVIAVSAVDQKDEVTDYSEVGPEISLAAPGDQITSDWLSSADGSGYANASGTSMAAPFVAGEAALIWGQHPDLTRDQVAELLEAGVKDLGTPGRDEDYGYGLVDAKMALSLADSLSKPLSSPATVTVLGGNVQSIIGSTQVNLTIPPQSFENAVNTTLRSIPAPANLPNGASFLTSVFEVDWGNQAPHSVLNLKWSDSSLNPASGASVYHWDGSRWISLGGELLNGEIDLGLYQAGVYAVGTPQPSATVELPQRFAGVTAVGTAIQISKATFPTGADTVLIAQANQFPDALAGAPLAYKLQAPILLTPSSGLTDDVRAEIERLAPKTIYMLGGPAALSANIEIELQKTYTVQRLYGYTAEGTARAIALALGTQGKAVIASALYFQDALSISSWAARQGVPILLTKPSALSDDTQSALNVLGVSKTFVIGGTAVVSDHVFSQLPSPTRLSGTTAYDTAAAVLQAYPPATAKLELASGENFPDALTGAVRAALNGTMVVLVPVSSPIPPSLANLLKTWQGKQVETLGGTVALPDKVVQTVETWLQAP